jgi:hypothetical protein
MLAEMAAYLASLGSNSGVQSMIATRTTIRKLIAAMNMMIVFFMAHIVAYQHYRIIVATLTFGNHGEKKPGFW